MTLSTPNPLDVVINGTTYKYLAFYYPGNNTDWDNVYGVPYFGNFWVEPFEVQLMGTVKASFYTAEAAYQASKWWNDSTIRNTFEQFKTGNEAFDYKRKHLKNTSPDGQYGGYTTGEEAMFEILKRKFSDDHPSLKAALGATGNAYLLEHGAKLTHQDMIWSDGNDGTGTNHLGICLMKVREFYFSGQGNPLAHEDSAQVILACTEALRAEMHKRGLSADLKDATTHHS
jgi:predicted NAD-dependent protein-ADP-ribosyltransferase YbiA (DUF1768 family)